MVFGRSLNDALLRLNLAAADSFLGSWFGLDDGRSLGRRTGAVFTVRFLVFVPEVSPHFLDLAGPRVQLFHPFFF